MRRAESLACPSKLDIANTGSRASVRPRASSRFSRLHCRQSASRHCRNSAHPASIRVRNSQVLTLAKTPIYCHSQHRNLSRLRRVIPDPVVEMNPATAAVHEIEQGEWVSISTPRGSIQARAHLNASLADGVIGGQHGWWQSCPDLGLPGYDPLSSDGANINLVIGDEVLDPVSGAAPHRAYPCQLHKLDDNSG